MNNVYIYKDDLIEYKATYELFNRQFKQQLISVDDLISKIEELSDEIEHLEEKIKDLEKYDEDDYFDEDAYMERKKLGI